jgi:hypothetical protein
MAKFLKKAIKHPGRLTEAAHRNGISKMEQAERWSHSSDPSKRGAGTLGKRLIKGKLHTGGVVPEDGLYEMKKGETVIPEGGSAENNYHGKDTYPNDTDRIKVPPSSDARGTVESVSGAVNHGNVMDAQPVVDSGADCGVGHWEGDCTNVKFVKG